MIIAAFFTKTNEIGLRHTGEEEKTMILGPFEPRHNIEDNRRRCRRIVDIDEEICLFSLNIKIDVVKLGPCCV